jgi:chorismate mutase
LGEPDPNADPTIRGLREQILENDRLLVETINTRLDLVARLKRYKDDRGLSFVDPEREELMIRALAQANGGPLSPEGLEMLYATIFDLTKREVSSDSGSRET